MTLAVTLRGEGVVPAITSSHSGGLLDFGYVLEKESTTYVLKVKSSYFVGALQVCNLHWSVSIFKCLYLSQMPLPVYNKYKTYLLSWQALRRLQLQNSSAVAVGFKAMLYSLSPSKTKGSDERVALLLGGYTDSKIQPVVGK